MCDNNLQIFTKKRDCLSLDIRAKHGVRFEMTFNVYKRIHA